MKTWNETFTVLAEAAACLALGQACVLVILTHVKGSAFRRPGAKLLIRADGSMTGNVSGGCLENDLRERALKAMQTGRQETVHYNTGSDEDVIWGLGLGCDGELDLLLVPVAPPGNWVSTVLACMESFEPVTLAWSVTPGPAMAPQIAAHRDGEPYLDVLEPPPDLVIVGAGDDAIPLVALAAESGFRVTIADHRLGYLSPDRFPRAVSIIHIRPETAAGKLPASPRTMALIKNHALEMDKKWAAYFDSTAVAYIGLLGPQKRCDKIRAGMTSGNLARVYGPAGLDIGSEGAEQIAIAIIAELIAVHACRTPGHLRHREAPIHGR
jgi:xanthine/CO dehydrogenase XdhC/CoxF family maturation factor